MKRITSILLVTLFLFSGCGTGSETLDNVITETSTIVEETINTTTPESITETISDTEETTSEIISEITTAVQSIDTQHIETEISKNHFRNMDDPDLHKYIKDDIYDQLNQKLDNETFSVENLQVTYTSQEYLDELAYNSKENIYFGKTVSELDKEFEGRKYVFTTDENGGTIVKEYDAKDNSYKEELSNVVTTAGVIVISVTISMAAKALGAPTMVTSLFSIVAEEAVSAALSGDTIADMIAGTAVGFATNSIGDVVSGLTKPKFKGFKLQGIIQPVTKII